jgi:hypothetical protein
MDEANKPETKPVQREAWLRLAENWLLLVRAKAIIENEDGGKS